MDRSAESDEVLGKKENNTDSKGDNKNGKN